MCCAGALPKRAVLGSMIFLGAMFGYMARTNLSIIVLAMTQPLKNSNEARVGPECDPDKFASAGNSSGLPDYGPRYEWDQSTVGLMLAAYFYGSILSSLPSGLIVEKVGAARTITICTLAPGILNLLVPLAAGSHYSLVFVIRFIMGFFGSGIYPAAHHLIARWAPPNERGVFVWCLQGGPFGTFVTMGLCGAIVDLLGWQNAFFTTSALMLGFGVLWWWLIYEHPDEHPRIAEKERNYIKDAIGTVVSREKLKTPLWGIFTSVPFQALLFAHFANMWGIYFLATNGPQYTLGVLGYNMKEGGLITGLPYLSRLLSGCLFATSGDYLRKTGTLSVGAIRRSYMLFSHVLPAVCLVAATYVGCDKVLAMAMIILTVTFSGAACQTSLQNHQDLAPNFAGTLYGIMNFVGSLPGVIVPSFIAYLISEHNGVAEWRLVFLTSSAIFVLSTLGFWALGSAEVQKWNDPANN